MADNNENLMIEPETGTSPNSEKADEAPAGFKKYFAYTKERFPIPGVALYAGLLFYACYFFGVKAAKGQFGLTDSILGFVVVFLVFFHLRVLDEHKDFDDDCIAHPDRLLSRGIITLPELRGFLYVALVVEIGISLYLGLSHLILWTLVFVWSMLMYKEFFVREWLKSRPGLYLLTHQLLVPFIGLYAMNLSYPVSLVNKPLLIMFFGVFFLGLMCLTVTYEIARKTWSPDRENPHADSYTRVWGIVRTVIVGAGIAGIGLTITLYNFKLGGISPEYSAAVVVLYLAFLGTEILFWRKPVRKNSKLVEVLGAVYMLGTFLTMALAYY